MQCNGFALATLLKLDQCRRLRLGLLLNRTCLSVSPIAMSCLASVKCAGCISPACYVFRRVRPTAAQLRVGLVAERPYGSRTVYISAQHVERPQLLQIVQRFFSESCMKVFAAVAVAMVLVCSEPRSQRNGSATHGWPCCSNDVLMNGGCLRKALLLACFVSRASREGPIT